VKAGLVRLELQENEVTSCFVWDNFVYRIKEYDAISTIDLIESGSFENPSFWSKLFSKDSKRESYELLGNVYELLQSDEKPRFLKPLAIPEIWGVGVSYKTAADLHEEDLRKDGGQHGIYDYVYSSTRPEIFFKGLERHSVGHKDLFGLRNDSEQTIVEAELGCILNGKGGIAAYTIVNDITAWDIEKECPLFLSYAKIFQGSCVFGPGIIPAFAIEDPLNLEVVCSMHRNEEKIFEAKGSTSEMKRSLEEMIVFLTSNNPVPPGTLLCTGTAVGIPHEIVVLEGDRVDISIDQLGELSNQASKISHTRKENS
jgi:2-dehydro-3-deoxy-D-arabinonate dehydratase